ncbi:MAG: hypothetical protein H0V04_07840 [Chloroflexi bacterium]|nr:hypothetical protein [Chloroflexota bacterium]
MSLTASRVLVVVLVGGVIAAACMPSGVRPTDPPLPSQVLPTEASSLLPDPTADPSPSPATTATPAPTPTLAPSDPGLARGRSFLECTGRPSTVGTGHDERGLDGIGDTPGEALEATLKEGWTIPLKGYERATATSGEVLFVYRAAGKVKVAIIAAFDEPDAQDRWAVVEIWACESEEFGPAAEMGEGRTIWVNDAGRILIASRGPSHCDMETATLIRYPFEGDQYVRDPRGIFEDAVVGTYDGDATLPDDAERTGYRQGEDVLWVAADGDALYVVRPDRVERWPRATGPIGCI